MAANGGVRGIEFARDIQPIFRRRCVQCHGGVHKHGGLSLLRREDALRPLPSGRTAVIPGQPSASPLLRRVMGHGGRMPPAGAPLTADEVVRLRGWIAEGAAWPRHWSLEPIRTAAPPAVKDRQWVRNPIDAFVLARLERSGITPSPEADPHTLIRRLSLDLTGLPPTLEEVDVYLRDWNEWQRGEGRGAEGEATPDPYERLVARLLASPHFGERWGRHWLDLARYADSDGYEVDKARPDAYRWRDWVIKVVNDDLPFDQFTIQQLAGDLLWEEMRKRGNEEMKAPAAISPFPHFPISSPITATGFHRQTLTNNEGGIDKEEYRVKAVMDRAATTGSVWLGLTVGCAQCHDHPYDPVTQRDYYALYAVFNNADETDLDVSGVRGAKLAVLTERSEPRLTYLFHRGDFLRPDTSAPVAPGVLSALHPITQRRSTPSTQSSSSTATAINRLDLARWLVDPANPLTARVAVNDVWLHLFGQGLVSTAEDFGATGERPTHPELLDYLAARFSGLSDRETEGQRDRGKAMASRFPLAPPHVSSSFRNETLSWSRKALIRLIVTSAAYRQASRHRPEVAQRDPRNRLLHRQNRYRVEAEIVRDLHLGAGGVLSPKIGGPSVFPPIPPDLEKISFRSQLPWKTSQGEDRYRRGMYTFFKRSLPDPNLVAFDCPDANATLARRTASNTPVQALATLNNEVYVEAARALARRSLDRPAAGDAARLTFLFRTCLARPPQPAETERLQRLLASNRVWYASHAADAASFAGTAERPSAELASWAGVAQIVMNLDEFLTRE